MKKLLFSLVAAAACGAVTADNVPATATFDSLAAEATFDVGKTEDQTVEIDTSNLGYWAVNEATDPELTVKAKSESDNYLSLNTGSTPLWRTFTGIGVVANAKAGTLPAGVDADGKVVSSDVKLTACTEWPTLTDFANEKLALFLFVPEEGDTSGNDAGLYAVGGAMVTPEGESTAVLTNKAYKLTVEGNANITNGQGWATISIKTYGDIYKTSGNKKISGFVIAVGGVIATRTETTGFAAEELTAAAATRIGNGTLIPAALATTDATIAGLGFQGEGGIDNVNLFADDFAVDADAMTVVIPAGVGYEGITLGENGAYSFTSTDAVTITLNEQAVAGKIVTVDYTGTAAYDKSTRTITFTPVKDATLTITVEDAKFMVGETPYADFATALAAANGGTLKLMSNPGEMLTIQSGTVTLDLNGQNLTSTGQYVIYNKGTLTIIDTAGNGTVGCGTAGSIVNGSIMDIKAGAYDGAISNMGTLTDNGGKFKVTAGLPEVTGKEYRDDDGDSYYTLEDVAGSGDDPEPETPEISDENGSIEEDEDGNYVVDTESTEITVSKLPADFTGKVVIPSTVEKINLGIGQLKVLAKDVDNPAVSYEITKALMVDDSGKLVLNAEVTVNDVPVKPALADGASETPFVVGETTAATVKTIPGLKYSLVWDSDLSFTSDAKGGTEPVQAKTDRLTLEDTTDKPTKRFYKVKVTK